MKVKKLYDLDPVGFTGGESYRPIVASDGLGFSMCRTEIKRGGPYKWHYKNHLEACYCIKGVGVLTNTKTEEEHYIAKDMVYTLEDNEPHTFKALTDVTLISIFNPPLKGDESHDENGVYKSSL